MGPGRGRGRRLSGVALAGTLGLGACTACTATEEAPVPSRTETAEPLVTPSEPVPAPTSNPAPAPEQVDPISLEALRRADLPGGGLRIGSVRERTTAYTSYDVSFGSTTTGRGSRPLRITGVLNVPDGRGPFPAVVLAHGYIDPAIYVRGQGMTRERGYLATRGFLALHVDYRNHAGSDVDPRVDTAVRLGYTTDVIAAAKALRATDEVPVNRRISLVGRSMGGGVTLKALTVEPGLFHAGVAWASVSSLEAENYRQFIADDPEDSQARARMAARHGLPADDPAFWRGLSPRPRFEEITEPVLLVHGRLDETCPPRWARQSQQALSSAGVDSTLEWYDDGHAFGPAFSAAMRRLVRFLRD